MFDDGEIYYIEGTYYEIYEAFGIDSMLESKKSDEETKAKDYNRTTCFKTKLGGLDELKKRWADLNPAEYTQGDFFGSALPTTVLQYKQSEYIVETRQNKSGKMVPVTVQDKIMEAMDKGKNYVTKDLYGYLDDNNDVNGINITCTAESEIAKQFWMISVLHNATGAWGNDPDDPRSARRLGVFVHFPKGKEWGKHLCNEDACKKLNPIKLSTTLIDKAKIKLGLTEETPFQKKFKESLNSEQVYSLYRDLVRHDGTLDYTASSQEKLKAHGCEQNGNETILPPSPEKKPENTIALASTPLNPKPNTNVTEFIKLTRIASKINEVVEPFKYKLSEDRNSLVHEKNKREILIGPKGEMTTDPINTAETQNPTATIEDIFIVMMRTYSIVFREGGEANFPSEKINLNFQQAKGASDEQKQNFLRLEADIRKRLIAEIERNAEQGHYPDAFLNKITFNGMKLNTNPLKRPADNVESESAEETETASKRPRSGTR